MTDKAIDKYKSRHRADEHSALTCDVCKIFAENDQLEAENKRLQAQVRALLRVMPHETYCKQVNGMGCDCAVADILTEAGAEREEKP